MRQAAGLLIAYCSLPFTALGCVVFVLGGFIYALAEGIKGLGEWIAK